MGIKINDGVRKQIVAAFVQCENYSEVARQFGISSNGVKKIVQGSSDCANVFNEKKEQNTKEVLEYLETKKIKVCGIIDNILDELSDRERLKKTPTSQLATTYGILIDKATLGRQISDSKETAEEKIIEVTIRSFKAEGGRNEKD